MKKILLASVAALGLAGSASAADMAVKAPPLVPVFSWTGCYLGVNGGWIGGRDEYSHSTYVGALPRIINNTTNVIIEDVANNTTIGPGQNSTITYNQVIDPYSHSSNASAGTAGGQFGCQYQSGAFVLGGEWDFNWSGLKEDHTATYGSAFWANFWNPGTNNPIVFNPNGIPFYGPYSGLTSVWTHKQLDWFSTARVRAGWAVWDRVLVYATGGLVVGALDAYTTMNSGGLLNGVSLNNDFFGAYRKNRIGWTAGGGFEWAFAQNWTAKAEFLYLDFGSFDYVSPYVTNVATACGANLVAGLSPCNAYHRTSIDATEYVARVGINYLFHLGPAALPVVARY
jgi:outer membrane immunogenic protein